MIRSLWTAASGMTSQQTNIDVIANNLANVNTAGFKKSRADFQDLMYQSLKVTGAPNTATTQTPVGIEVGSGSKTAAISKIFTAGSTTQTGNQLDLAIQGDGFLQVLMPDGTTAYTRAGSLKKDAQGRLTTSEGNPLLPEIVIPTNATSIAVGSDGTVSVMQSGQAAATQVGNIQLAQFTNQAGLSALGGNMFQETASSGAPVISTPGKNGTGSLSQGYLEMSNVNIMEEMVNMIAGQRAYEVNSKAIQTSDEMLQQAAALKRG